MIRVVLLLSAVVVVTQVVLIAASLPLLRAVRERHRVDSEVRLAEWHVQRVAREALQRMLDEARRSS